MNLTVLKAACLADLSTYRTKAAMAGLKARCGPAVLETLEYTKGFKELLEFGPCKAYEELKTLVDAVENDIQKAEGGNRGPLQQWICRKEHTTPFLCV